MRVEVNARGLSTEEIQDAIDSRKNAKGKTISDFLEDQGKAFLRLTELVPDFAEEMLKVIKKHHPHLLKHD